jgi:Tfp pilus assembly protein PilF
MKTVFQITLSIGFLLVSLCWNIDSDAQKKPGVLKKRDLRNIKSAIEKVIDQHRSVLEYISAPGTDIDAPDVAVKTNIEQDPIYLSAEVPVETDYYTKDSNTLGWTQGIRDYLYGFNKYFKTKKESDFIHFSIEWDDKVYTRTGDPFAIVRVTQQFDGESQGKKLPSKGRYFYIQLTNVAQYVWNAKISRIVFADKGLPQGLSEMPVEEGSEEISSEREYEEAYCRAIYNQGILEMQNERHGKAFFCFSEAKQNKNYKNKAEEKIRELDARIERMNKGTFNEVIFEDLKRSAAHYADKKNYILARKYYIYAREKNPLAQNIVAEIEQLELKIKNISKVSQLFDNGHYQDAGNEALRIMQSPAEKDNSYLLLWLAKCHAKANNDAQAESYYQKAVSADRSNVDIYKWRAEFFRERYQYDEAIKSYIQLLANSEDNSGPVIQEAMSMQAFCGGLQLFDKGLNSLALDSFKRACDLFPGNAEAWIYQSRCFNGIKEKYQLIDSAIAKDSNYAPAYVEKANLLSDNDKDSAIVLYKKAIEKDKNNVPAYWGLGNVYLAIASNNDMNRITEAKSNFDRVIKLEPIRYDAYHKKGKCNYLLGQLQEAESDFARTASSGNYERNDDFNCDYGFLKLMTQNYSDAKNLFDKAKRISEAKYGMALAMIKLSNNAVNVEAVEYLSAAFSSRTISRQRVESDLQRLGISELLQNKDFRKKTGYDKLN